MDTQLDMYSIFNHGLLSVLIDYILGLDCGPHEQGGCSELNNISGAQGTLSLVCH